MVAIKKPKIISFTARNPMFRAAPAASRTAWGPGAARGERRAGQRQFLDGIRSVPLEGNKKKLEQTYK